MENINEPETLRKEASAALDEIARYYVGNRDNISKILASIISSGHVLLMDYPGIGKTFIVKLFSRVLGIDSRRIQFTPDLLPSDIIGTKVWRPDSSNFQVVKGPVFSNLILADEINRAPPKTQAALLEAMEEKQVTIEGETVRLSSPFIVLATENPVELEGTYPLPEAQLDRFMIEITLGYPDDDSEVLNRRISWKTDDPSSGAETLLNAERLIEIQKFIEASVSVSPEIVKYISEFSQCRKDPRVLAGPSPRGLISLMRISRAIAFLENRTYVIPDDVKKIAQEVLGHRIVLRPELSLEDISGKDIIREYLAKIQVPK
ncbi:MAG: MoxR family ATPase [Candidatus Thermoplasmatota archaeon]|nr:MoxR family ATPase [Candidatus Thermoplasmatota archaeon]MCL5731455.1 MoxR family ATPase [Candidatus Thermoplasmatota archaeon]